MHNAWKKIFDLRPPLSTMTSEPTAPANFKSSPCSHGDMSKNIHGLPVL